MVENLGIFVLIHFLYSLSHKSNASFCVGDKLYNYHLNISVLNQINTVRNSECGTWYVIETCMACHSD